MAESRTMHLWAEEGEARHVPVANVATKLPIDKIYAYAVPEDLVARVAPGQRVLVPLGRSVRLAEAFVLDVATREWDTTLRSVAGLIDEHSWLTPHLLALGRWMSDYYSAPLGLTLSSMVPAAVRRQSGFDTRRLLRLARPAERIVSEAGRIGPQQRRLLDHMPAQDQEIDVRDLCGLSGVSEATVRAAVQRGWLEQRRVKRARAAPSFDEPRAEPTFELNEDQRRATASIDACLAAAAFEVLLIQGVSGSGKTEVYIHAMKRVIERGEQVILLVPEIALTTQLVHRFASRFSDVAVLHSGLTDVQRSLVWHAIREGQRQLIIGTRSAVFAPCRRLGLIVIDEEQDTSFKNQPTPRFHARDVAVYRAQLEQIPLILGSATPALETYYNCRHKPHYRCVQLRKRVAGLGMPTVELVDMRDETADRSERRLVSRLLEIRLTETLKRGRQAVLFLNQRGYASALFCPRCRARVLCPHCRASLVLHRSGERMHCHHCHARTDVPETCPDSSCGSRLMQMGIGTERVEEEIRARFPRARVARVDSDSMSDVRSYEKVLSDFAARRLDVMVGTQIVAKGLDFPGVALVGVISADTALFQPDFRANERTFQLVTQVAGRAGRADSGGRAVVQTLMADLPALQAAVNHDYETFAEHELGIRREMSLPPYARLARWVLQDAVESRLERQAVVFAEVVRDAVAALQLEGAEVFGPHPSPIERIRKLYRYDVLLRTADSAGRAAVLKRLRFETRPEVRVKRVTLDVDPVSLL